MYPIIQFLSAATVYIPVLAGVSIICFSLLIWIAKRRYARGSLHVSQIELDSMVRMFRLANVAVASGALVFTAGAYFLQSYYSRF